MRVADYIAKFLVKNNIRHIFLVTGGGAMFLNDGIAACKDINPVCLHHEQAAAMAAVGYAKYNYTPGAALLTTGCGGTNAITGLLNAYQDNIPCIFISGQVKRKETTRLSKVPLRQFGVQEVDIITIVESITKYSVMLDDADRIRYELEKAIHIATTGRMGPVWIDVPMDIQGAIIDEKNLEGFIPSNKETPSLKEDIELIKNDLKTARRPIIIAGQGIKLSKTVNLFQQLVEDYQVPYVTSRLGVDILPSSHPLFIGRIGNKGDRAGNFAVQNADYILVLGSRLSVSTTGHEYDLFGREAKKVVIDIDEDEHNKETIRIDKFIHADLKDFFAEFIFTYKELSEERKTWIKKCLDWKNKWSIFLKQYDNDSSGINLYKFMERLSATLDEKAVIISDAGSCVFVVPQAMMFKKGHRYITSGAQAEMGYSLPAAIGAAQHCSKGEQIIAITGDGSLQMNIQELQTLVHYQFPVKLFVWNNDGYLSIRTTQRKFFANSLGTDNTNGVSFPNLEKIADAYGLKYVAIKKICEMDEKLQQIYNYCEPVLCEVFCMRDQEIIPNVSALRKEDGTMVSKPFEDMYPYLSREEFLENMIIKPLDN